MSAPAQYPEHEHPFAQALERANAALEAIGDYAHDKSTGPAVWDPLWEVRRMAYEGVQETLSIANSDPAIDAAREQDRARAAAPQAAVSVSDEQIEVACPFCASQSIAMHPNDLATDGGNMGIPFGDCFFAHCDGCGAEGPPADNEPDARANWNRQALRASKPEAPHAARVKGVKVERTCPRCRTYAYHWGNDKGIPNRIACVNCGHEWQGRITKDEQS